MDTIGIDENNIPVIIEYKRSSNQNVINQGLFYLNWLVGHRGDFQWLVLDALGKDVADRIDWSGPRLICIANDFTKYDEHAVKQMNRNIALIRYHKFNDNLLLLEQITSTSAPSPSADKAVPPTGAKKNYKTVSDHLREANSDMIDRYEMIAEFLRSIGDDVETKILDFYVAFRRIKNFACVELRNQADKILVFVKVDPSTMELEDGFTRDMREIGHFGTGDLEVTIRSDADFERAKTLFEKSYYNS